MKAIRIHDYGTADQLVLDDAPKPEPKAGEILVKMLATGVNPADWKYRSGAYKAFAPLQMPYTPGLDGAGVVEAVGEGVAAFKPGDAVYGVLPSGGYAEYAVAPAAFVAPKPKSLSFDEAATVPVGALTAWGQVEAAGVKAGQRVLVQGAAGGVGLYVVQLAKAKGAYVIGVASAKNLDYVRSIGADEVVDYKGDGLAKLAKTIDVVLDTVGGPVIENSWALLKEGGVLVTVAGMIDPDTGSAHGVKAMSTGRADPDNLNEIGKLIDAGKLKAKVGVTFPLAQAKEAQQLSETGHGQGRIILHIADK